MIVLLFGAWYNADIKQRRRCWRDLPLITAATTRLRRSRE
jgi:hypothetical protein